MIAPSNEVGDPVGPTQQIRLGFIAFNATFLDRFFATAVFRGAFTPTSEPPLQIIRHEYLLQQARQYVAQKEVK